MSKNCADLVCMNGGNMNTENIIEHLCSVIKERKENPMKDSYTCYLFEQGINKILKKVGEESAELIIAAKDKDTGGVISETSDLIYHVCVLLVALEMDIKDVFNELEMRTAKLKNLKEMYVADKST